MKHRTYYFLLLAAVVSLVIPFSAQGGPGSWGMTVPQKGLPLSPIPKRNECQLNACKQFYEEILKLHENPKVIKRCYSGGDPHPHCDLMECFTVQKSYFDKLMKPLLDLCTQEHPDDPDYNQHFIEGNESCKNPADSTNALLLFLDGEPAIESLNQRATLYGDLESEGRVGYCYYSIKTLEATRDACGENSCSSIR
jgi:hypothetical protein